LQLKQLSYFVTIIESKSFSQAAKKLYISQPSLSQSIHSLEQELGFPLLIRSKHGTMPTEMGKQVYEDVQELLTRIRAMEENWRALDRARRALCGTVRIVAFSSAYPFLLRHVLEPMKQAYPNIVFQLLEARRSDLFALLAEHRADLGVGNFIDEEFAAHAEQAGQMNLSIEPLCQDAYKIAVSVKNPLSRSGQISAGDAEHVSFSYYSGGDEVVQSYFKPYFNENLALELSSLEKIVQVSVDGRACGVLPERISRQGLLLPYGKDAVRFLTVEGFSVPTTHCLITPMNYTLSPEAFQVRDRIRSAFEALAQD
jgi:DNA-binding transcriptional LysR family regulator